MNIYRNLDKSGYDKNSVVTVGTFDGVHIGHREIIRQINSLKESGNYRSVIVTFDPHPRLILRDKHKDIKILSTTEEKLETFEALGVDAVYILEFSTEFAATSAEEFLKKYLLEGTGLTELVLGFDHSFGKNREGNYETLSVLSNELGFKLHKVDELKLGKDRVNSTTIRGLLLSGDAGKAAELLGADYSFTGKVVPGDRRGSTIGFPTANVAPSDAFKLIPKNGVYAVTFSVNGEKYSRTFSGMMNIGRRPTISDNNEVCMEVNVFDFTGDIYGRQVKIGFLHYIREEKKFASLEELVLQLNKDKDYCINFLNKTNI
jgi:riboflavin kinase/FMN adenylyltransferase